MTDVQVGVSHHPHPTRKEPHRAKYDRTPHPGSGQALAHRAEEHLAAVSTVLDRLGPKIQWVQSYVTDDTIYCVYIAPSEELIREHAKPGGFPANRVARVRTIIDPTTSEG